MNALVEDRLTLSDFDYALPAHLIAQEPSPARDRSRLMVLDRASGRIEHRVFSDITQFLSRGDVLVINNTKVIPCRVPARKKSGGRSEIFLIAERGINQWEALVKGTVGIGQRLDLGPAGEAEVTGRGAENVCTVRFHGVRDVKEVLPEIGETPLPPYITRKPDARDRERYQTVYASREGAVAAPTAGMHFTKELLSVLETRGVEIVPITLFVGPGTFQPVRVETITEHRMLPERYEISESSAERINCAAAEGRRVIAVGTTSVRTVESASAGNGIVAAGSGTTSLFITPGYAFNVIGGMITNFHLPKSTLLMLISAYAGRERVLTAYGTAVEEQYRFYSYGDAMFIR